MTMAQQIDAPQQATATAARAIVSPLIDFLFCGGLSVLVVLGLFAFARVAPDHLLFTRTIGVDTFLALLVVGLLVNMPHFMASYRLLYRSKEQVARHRWVSTWVPLLMVLLVVVAVLAPGGDAAARPFANKAIVDLFTFTAVLLLAWHYTAQAWGMVASFLFVQGIRMERVERWLIRSGCYALFGLHLLWACKWILGQSSPLVPEALAAALGPVTTLYELSPIVALLTLPAGLFGFLRLRRRTGQSPPVRAWVPWAALYLWYALIWFHPGLFVLLQMFHALQYMVFPIRVEMNQYVAQPQPVAAITGRGRGAAVRAAAREATQRRQERQVRHAVLYYAVLVLAGLVVKYTPVLAVFAGDRTLTMTALVMAFVSIHHYLIDGAIWKLRNPEVRRDLFAHLAPS